MNINKKTLCIHSLLILNILKNVKSVFKYLILMENEYIKYLY